MESLGYRIFGMFTDFECFVGEYRCYYYSSRSIDDPRDIPLDEWLFVFAAFVPNIVRK